MKKTMKLMAVAALVLVCGKANAQLGINVGYAPETLTTKTTSGNTTNSSSKDLNGFFAGVNYNLPLAGDLFLSLGAQGRFNVRTSEETALTVTAKTTDTQMLVDIPVLVNYGLNLNPVTILSFYAGPMLTYALSGNTNVTTHSSATNLLDSNTDFNWYGDNTNNERMNLSGVVGVALDYDSFRLFGGYRFGLVDLDNRANISTTSAGVFVGLGVTL